jgi:hypothetical protein
MLNNPNWGKTENDISLGDFIEWLEHKNPDETYNYKNKEGLCCLGQYMKDRGMAWRYPGNYHTVSYKLGGGNTVLKPLRARHFQATLAGDHFGIGDEAVITTFGDTLRRVKAFKEKEYA